MGALRILIVDDSPEDRAIYRRLLAADGEREVQFVETETGEEGLAAARRERPDCVLLDYRLPDLDGLEFLRELPAGAPGGPGGRPPPVIVLTGKGNEEVAVAAMKSGAEDYLVKDTLSAQSLRRAVDNALEKARLRAEVELLAAEQHARRQAEEANRLKDEFLAVLSHELRTPLNAILGWAHLLRTGKLEAAAAGDALGRIERNARAQAKLIDDLLEVSQIVAGKLRLEMRPVDLASAVAAALDSMAPAAEAKGIAVAVHLDPGAPLVLGDAGRLQQVAWNLLSNAIKFTPAGGAVQVRVEAHPREVRVVVSDTGAGIPPRFLPFVFDRFRQADSSTTRAIGGLGLGLSIVRNLVELHGGRVEAASGGEGRGATFTVALPVHEEPQPATLSQARRPEPPLPPSPAAPALSPSPDSAT